MLILLERISLAELRACMAEAWKARAPKRLLAEGLTEAFEVSKPARKAAKRPAKKKTR